MSQGTVVVVMGLGACSVQFPKLFKMSFHLRFGLEHHMTNIRDIYFALLDRPLEEYEKHAWHLSIGDVCNCWADWYPATR